MGVGVPSDVWERTTFVNVSMAVNASGFAGSANGRIRKIGEINHGQLCFIPKIPLMANTWKGFGLSQAEFRHRAVAVGGTFDILHVGHEKLLAKAFELGDLVFVGVTGDHLVSTLNKDHPVRKFAARQRDLRRLLKARGWLQRARITELRDPFGPATRRKRLDALVVSEETRANGLRVNALRRTQGLKPLRLYVVRMVRTKDGLLLSDTRIRRGEVNPQGKPNVKVPGRIR